MKNLCGLYIRYLLQSKKKSISIYRYLIVSNHFRSFDKKCSSYLASSNNRKRFGTPSYRCLEILFTGTKQISYISPLGSRS
jgi:hypothetical protein